jgi:hypothetical protein
MTTMSTISGLNHTACGLAPSGFGLPLPGLPADFATDLLAKLWSGGILAVCDHPLGNIIEFHGSYSNPNDLRLTWREWMSCLNKTFETIQANYILDRENRKLAPHQKNAKIWKQIGYPSSLPG